MPTFNYSRAVPVRSEYDVIVAGSGPAGICAAVAAAREGAHVALIESAGAIGGNLTVGHVSPLLGSVAEGTMYDEIVKLLSGTTRDKAGVITRNGREMPLNPEEAKIKLTKFVADAGVDVFLCTTVADVIKDENRLRGLVLAGAPCGLFALHGNVIIDATGDGTVSALAGAEISIGRDGDGKVQPCTLEFMVNGVDESVAISAWGGSDPVKLPSGEEYRALCKRMCADGVLPSNVHIVRLHRTGTAGERSVNATQINDIDALDPAAKFDAEVELRRQIEICYDFLVKYVPGYENCYIKSSGTTLGVRETRRVKGDDTVTDEYVEQGLHSPDVIVHNAWFLIDIHNPAGGGQAEGFAQPAQPYDIPYGALLPVGIEGLLTAGRCISGSHRAHASYRVMAICMAMGEAAGVAAALASAGKTTPRALGAKPVQQRLLSLGAKLFD
ncbi:MAG: FAD-dependent oxidoreductase [Clostridia bacterium]|nr:FAD-dependent oxidoreductase [Clostridia bacterium]